MGTSGSIGQNYVELGAEAVLLCDNAGAFIRHIIYNEDGTINSVQNTTLDGVSPYTPSGTVVLCDSNSDLDDTDDDLSVNSVVLCDDNGSFVRTYYYTELGLLSGFLDTEFDGTTGYVTIGTISICESETLETDQTILQDSNDDVFIRNYVFNPDGTLNTTYDTLLDGTTPHATVDPVKLPGTDVEFATLCDDNQEFNRYYVYNNDGTVDTTLDTELDGTTLYVPVGTVHQCVQDVMITEPVEPSVISGAVVAVPNHPTTIVHNFANPVRAVSIVNLDKKIVRATFVTSPVSLGNNILYLAPEGALNVDFGYQINITSITFRMNTSGNATVLVNGHTPGAT